MKSLLILGLAVNLVSAFPDPLQAQEGMSATQPSQTLNIVNANGGLRAKILPHLKKGNLIMSTISLASVLGMLLAGAKKNTKSQLLNTFGMATEKLVAKEFQGALKRIKEYEHNPNVTLQSANRIYVDNGDKLLPDYMSLLKRHYYAEPKNIDFKSDSQKASKEINEWVEQQTNRKIKDLLKPSDVEAAKLVLVNAIYFKGDWQSKFNENHTKEMDFATSKDEKTKVKMMIQEGDFGIIENSKDLGQASVLQLPYKGNSVEMLIILPKIGTSLDAAEKNVRKFLYEKDLTVFPKSLVSVLIPKFKLKTELNLNAPLQKIGLSDMFTGSADFSGMVDQANLKVSLIKQKAFIEVNEEGSEAAAATTAVMVPICAGCGPKRMIFKADRPFIFLIRESKTGLILFSGHVVDPNKV